MKQANTLYNDTQLQTHCLIIILTPVPNYCAQLGFKKGTGCTRAIYAVKQVVDYYVRGDSTVNICTMEITKAFDKVIFGRSSLNYYYVIFLNIL